MKRVVLFDDDKPIYERQEKETDKAWNAFLIYRDMGPERTQPKTAEKLGKSPKYRAVISGWSMQFGWRQRAAEYDRAMDAASRRTKVDEMATAHREMLLVATSMWKLAAKDLMRWHRKMDKAKEDEPILSARDTHALADAGMKLQRLLMGEPDAIQEHRHEVTADDERKTLRGLLMNKEALAAMDVIAEKMDSVGNGNGTGNGGLH